MTCWLCCFMELQLVEVIVKEHFLIYFTRYFCGFGMIFGLTLCEELNPSWA